MASSSDCSEFSQPTQAQAFRTPGNPAEDSPAERTVGGNEQSGGAIDRRVPPSQSSCEQDATPSALGYGVRGAPAGEEKHGVAQSDVDRNKELEGEQMRAPGEGAVADSVQSKPGASGGESDLASNLDRKKKEQESLRENRADREGKQKAVEDVLNEHRQTS